MRGQGEAWSLICGLWAPGDPQFYCSLPVTCGALSWATSQLPSYSWEHNMELESKNEVNEGPKDPAVSQESEAVENHPLTNGTDPAPSNDSYPASDSGLVDYKMSTDSESDSDDADAKDSTAAPCEESTATTPATGLCKWVPHPGCKHTLEELKQMSMKLKGSKHRQSFMRDAYCLGRDPVEKMKKLLLKESNLPRKEVRKISKLYLPKIKRRDFYLEIMKGRKVETVLRRYLKTFFVQEWLLCTRLQLTDNKLLFKQFKLPNHELENSEMPACRPLKDWFNLFLQESSIEEALGRVKKMVLQGPVIGGNNIQEKLGPNNVNSANQCAKADSSKNGKQQKKQTFVRVYSKKSKSKRNKKFQQLNEGQKKVYDSWREQGLSHFDALTIVMKFPRAWAKKPIKPSNNVPKPNAGSAVPPVPNLCSNPGSFGVNAPGMPPIGVISQPSMPPMPNLNVNSGPVGVNAQPGLLPMPNLSSNAGPIGVIPQPGMQPWGNGIPSVPPPFLPNLAERGHAIFQRPPPPILPSTNNVFQGVPVTALGGMPLEHSGTNNIGILNSPFSQQPILQVPPVIPPFAVPPPTGANILTGVRVPQKSTFVEEPVIPLQPTGTLPQPSRDPPSSTDSLQLFIVPPEYPEELLSDDEIDAIENSIRVAVLGIEDQRMKPIFECSPQNGKYKVICKDELAKKWLLKYVNCMYPVVALKIIPAVPVNVKVSIVLPLCKNEDTDRIMKFIARQNPELNVGQWDVIQRCNDDENTTLSFMVDQDAAKVLKHFQEISFKMGSAVIFIDEDPSAKNKDTSKSGSVKAIAPQSLDAPGSSRSKLNLAREHAFKAVSHQKVDASKNEHKLQTWESSQSLEQKVHKRPSRFDQPKAPQEPNHGVRRRSEEGRGYVEHQGRSSMEQGLPKPSKSNYKERSEPDLLSRRNSSDYIRSRYAEPELQPRRNSSEYSYSQFVEQGPNFGKRNSSGYSRIAAKRCDVSRHDFFEKCDGFYKNGGPAPRYIQPSQRVPSPPNALHEKQKVERSGGGHFGSENCGQSGSSKPSGSHGVSRRHSQEYSHNPIAGPHDVLTHSTNKPRVFKKSYADFLQPPQVPAHVFKERLGLDHAGNPKRSPSPEFDELLRSAKSALNLPDEPTAAQPKPVGTQTTLIESSIGRKSDCINRMAPPRRISASGEHIHRDRSSLGSYASHSRRSPPSQSKQPH